MPLFPKVSYIVPCYNYGKYVRQCLESIQKQDYPNLEIIVINDGSTDDSEQIIRSTLQGDDRAKILSQENKGLLITKNSGVLQSSGEFFCLLDADDYVPLDRTRLMIEAFLANPEASLVYADALVIDGAGNPIKRFFETYPPLQGDFSVEMFSNYCFVPFTCALFRRSSFDKTGPFWSSAPRGESQDYLKMIEVGLQGKAVRLDQVLGFYRRHGNSVTDTGVEKRVENYNALHKSFEELLRRHPDLAQKVGTKRIAWRYARCHFMGGFYVGLEGKWVLARKQFRDAYNIYPSLLNAVAEVSTWPLVNVISRVAYQLATRRLY